MKRSSYRVATLVFLAVVLVGLSAATLNQLRYSELDKRHYLTDEQIAFVRPGLNVEVKEVNVGTDSTVSVTYKVTDDRGLPLDNTGVYTPGVVTASFILAYLPADKNQYVAYTTRTVTSPITNVTAVQASSDSGGTLTKVADGTYKYTFKAKLPAGADLNATHSIGMYLTRDLTEWGLAREVANEVVNFLPSGGPVQKVRDVVTNEACARCHDPLAAHGGSRQAVELCVLCHTPQTIDPDTGHTQDFAVLVHKIHRGKNLPSVLAGKPYIIIGNRQSVHDYSHVAIPQDIRNCQTCHAEPAEQHEAYLLRPNRAACGSCHDDVNFATGENHVSLPQVSDKFCANCHFPEGELEFDASIKGAHTIPTKSQQLKGVKIELVDVTNTTPGQKPVVKFRLKNGDDSPIAPAGLSSFNLIMAGPTIDYQTLAREAAIADSVPMGDAYTYTFKAAIPADATGTFVIGAEGYRNVNLNPGTAQQLSVREAADNPWRYFAVTDSSPKPRREIVSDQKCNSCHEDLVLHGGQRRHALYCVTCHNPAAQDTARRPQDKLPSQSIDLKFMIHRIHMGEELTRDFTVYGRGGPVTFNEVLYPGDQRNCAACHVGDTYKVPSAGVLATVAPREFYSPIRPNSTACLGCHDTLDAAAHTYLNTAPFGEACGACHGVNAEFSVAKLHARP